MKNGIIGAVIAVAVLLGGYAVLNGSGEIAASALNDTFTKQSLQSAGSIYQSRVAELPAHQLYCIPETKSHCSLTGCEAVDPKVFVLLNSDDEGLALYRCDEKPCDAYPATDEMSGVNLEIRTIENHGILFKTSTLDQSYVEVVTLGTDTLVSHGHCYKVET